jgi:hypothetical protein
MTGNNGNQITVSYIGDLAHNPSEDVLLVECDEDYVKACRKLSSTQASTAGLKVWVRSQNQFAWLKDFTEQIGCPAVFGEKSPRLVLADKWNIVLPDWLTDADVLDQGLLDLDIEFKAGQTSFGNRILSYFLGSGFKEDVFNPKDLTNIIKSLISTEAKVAFKKHPIIDRALKSKCETWAQSSNETWIKNLCLRLSENTDEIWQWLSLWSCLKDYPEKLLEYVLAPEQVLFVRSIPMEAVYDLPLEPTAREQILTQIELLFEKIQHQVTSSEEFRKALKWTSGRLYQEYRFISKILGSRRFSPTAEDVQQVQTKFRHCPGVSVSSLNSLRHYIAPSRPKLIGPEEKWDSTEWIQWATKEYTPYRTWQIHNNQDDEGLEKTVACFSDWFIDEYAAIHTDPDLSLIYCLAGIASNKLDNQLSIILLVDCLPMEFFDLLDDAFRNIGYSRHELRYRFAALPTITEYNKPALVSGYWEQNAGNYEAILKARAQADWNKVKVVYLSSLKGLSELTAPQESTVVLFNFLDGDELLHSDVESKGTTYDEELHRLFARMAESVDRISKEWTGPREHVSVYVVTDHGACRILEEEKQSFDSSVVSKLFSDEKYRFAALDEKQVADIPDNLWMLGYQFKQPYVSDNRIFFLPRGHNTVRQPSKAKGFLHGGVTPEEVIVPTALYKLVKAVWRTPASRFLNLDLIKETGRAKFYIQRVVTVNIEIQNPNTIDIRILRASVTSPEADLKSCDVGVIPAGSVNTIQMNCYFKKAALGEKNLEIEIAYEISDEQHTLALMLECEFKSAMAGGFSLRDL